MKPASIQPLVTVVIPTYNRLALLSQAIESIVAQTYNNWELIIVDDGSDDGTPEFICSLNDSRIHVLPMKHMGNIAALRNAGVRSGSGEWLAFLDSDDLWVPRRLEIHLSVLLQEGKSWGYGRSELMNSELHTIPYKAGEYRPISGWIANDVLTTEASVNLGTLLVKRELFEEAGRFNEDAELIYREDYEFVLRLALKSEALAIPELLLRIREHGNRATNLFEYGNERTATVYKHFIRTHPEKSLAGTARRRMAGELAESAVNLIKQKEYLLAAGRLGKALIHGDSWRHLLSVIHRGFI